MWTIAQAGLANAGLTFDASLLGLEFFGLFGLSAVMLAWEALRVHLSTATPATPATEEQLAPSRAAA